MKLNNMVFFVAVVTTSLLGCDNSSQAKTNNNSAGYVEANFLPLITNAVHNALPKITPDHKAPVMSRVCKVAYGELEPTAFKDDINRSGILQEKSVEGEALSQLTQSNTIAPYQTACVAYIIESIESVPDIKDYVTTTKNANGEINVNTKEDEIINLMPFRLAVLRANARLYAKIAAEAHEKKIELTTSSNNDLYKIFSGMAGEYLGKVKQYNEEAIKNQYQLLLLQKGRFSFKSNDGYMVDIRSEGAQLYYYGAPWLANGYILGVEDKVQIKLD